MTKEQAYSKLIQIAAALVRGDGLPSPILDDHHQKTYSARKVAHMAMERHEWQKEIACEMRKAADALMTPNVKLRGAALLRRPARTPGYVAFSSFSLPKKPKSK